MEHLTLLKLIYFEKATKFYEIFTLPMSYVVPVKSKMKISQNYVAFSEYMNFTQANLPFRNGANLTFNVPSYSNQIFVEGELIIA